MKVKSGWVNKYVEQKMPTLDPDLFTFEFLYIPLTELKGSRNGGWEHNILHSFDSAKEYYYNIPPVPVTLREGIYHFNDGFHRVNFCKRYNVPVPVVIETAKPSTHIHKIQLTNEIICYHVKDIDCQKDLEKRPRAICTKSKK